MKKGKKAATVKDGKTQQRFVFKKLNKQLISVSAALVLLTANYGIAPLQAFATETATTEELKLPEGSLPSTSDPLPLLPETQETSEESVIDEGTMETVEEASSETVETVDSSEEKASNTLQLQPRSADWVTTDIDANTVKIKSYKGDTKIITIPAEIDGKAVVVDLKTLMRSKLYQTVEEFTIENSGGKTPVKITGNLDMLFNNSTKLRTASFGNADTSEVTTMSSMFAYCGSLTALDISGLDTSRVTKMDRMFADCKLLSNLDLTHFDTSQVTTMDRVFYGCNGLTSLNISNFDTSQVTTMNYMFSSCKGLTSLNVSSFDTSQVKKMEFLFSGCTGLTSLDITNFDTSQVTSMQTMFSGCSGLTDLDVTQLNTSQVTTMESMFSGCSGLTILDVSQLDTGNVTDMTNMFSGCKGLSTVDISTFNTSKLKHISSMFASCESIETFVFPDLDTSNLISARYVFSSCTSLKNVDLTNLDTSQVTGMNDMFRGCVSLETLDLSSLETSQVVMMNNMFQNCTNLKELNLSNFDTTKATNMTHIFDGCENLKKLTISPMFEFKDQHDLRELPQGLPTHYWVREHPKEVYNSTTEFITAHNGETGETPYTYEIKKKIKVSFDHNGGSGTLPAEQELFEGEKAIEPASYDGTKGSQIFNGWTLNGSPFDFSQPVTESITLKADWRDNVNAYQVSFDANGGTGTMGKQSIELDTEEKLSKNTFTRKGYTFTGWNTQADGKGTDYTDQQKVKNLTNQAGKTVTLYAQWKPISYQIKFDANQGTGSMSTQAMKYDQKEKLTKNTFTRSDYTFSGWNTQADGKGTTYADQADIENLTDEQGKIITLYAQWENSTYTIKFDANSGTGSMIDQSAKLDEEETLTANSFTKKGYSFTGWNTQADGKGDFYSDKEKVKNLTDQKGETVILYAQWKVIDYTVTYDSNGGEKVTDGTYTVEKGIDKLPTPTRKGYQFKNWLDEKDQVITKIETGSTGNRVLKAQWIANTYEVKFDANGGSGSMTNQGMTYDQAAKLTKNSITRSGYIFSGWNTQADGKGTAFADQVEVKNLTDEQGKVVTLYAQWKLVDYTVTYDSNGGEKVSDGSYTIEKGIDNLPTPTRKGYQFKNWLDEKDQVITKIETGSTGNITLKAQWKANTYEVKFDANGGTGSMTNQGLTYDQAVKLTKNGFAKSSYVFSGWNTQADGKGTTYTDQAEVKNLTDEQGKAVTLYAQWKANTYGVKFDSNGGTGTMINQVLELDVEESLSKNDFTRKGYTFTGWNTSADGKGTTYSDEAKIKNLTDEQEKTVTLFAQWKLVDYKVTYDSNGGEKVTDGTYTIEKGIDKLPAPTRKGYQFKNWLDEKDQVITKIETGSTGNKTLKAQWKAHSYEVKFDANGGAGSMANQGLTYDQAAKLTQNTLTRSGYVFSGWNTQADGKGTAFVDQVEVKNLTDEQGKAVTLYAQWKTNTYGIKFDSNGGTGTMTDQVLELDAEEKLSTNEFTRKGYSFTGWNTSLDGKGTAYSDETKVKNLTDEQGKTITLYAQWKLVDYTVAYDSNGGEKVSDGTYTVEKGIDNLPTLTRKGYQFKNWLDEKAQVITKIETGTTGNRTLKVQWQANTYEVNFDANGGTGSMTNQGLTYDQVAKLTKNSLTRSGYVFSGWNTQADGKGTAFADQVEVKNLTDEQGKAVTLYAQWKTNTYGVKFDSNGGTGTMTDQVLELDAEEKLSTNEFTRKGYSFTGWNTSVDGKGTAYSDEAAVKNLSDEAGKTVTLYAQWKLIDYTMNYDSADGEKVADDTYTVEKGIDKLPTPTRKGYQFQNWLDEKDQVITKIETGSTGNRKLKAQWKANTYEVKFDSNGGTGSMANQTLTYDLSAKLTKNDFTRSNYIFTGWNTQSDGKGTSFANEAEIKNLTDEQGKVITLYAQWEINVYTVKFDSNAGTGSMTDQTVKLDEEDNLSENTYTRKGYEFTGWNTQADGKGKFYSDKSKIKNLTDQKGETVILYAQWKLIDYKVTYDSTGGEKIAEGKYTIEKGIDTLPTPTRKGYEFENWLDEKDQVITKIEAGTTGDRTLKAQWKLTDYKVTYDSAGGEKVAEGKYTIEKGLDSLPIPTRKGYEFKNWLDEKDQVITKIETGQTGDRTLKAQWKLIDYKVTYDSTGGEKVAEGKYTIEKDIDTLPIPTRKGNSFENWLDEKDQVITKIESGQTGDRTLKAKWRANTYEVKFDANSGTGSMTNQSFTYDQAAKLTPNTFTRSGYAFAGWNTQSDGKGTAFTDQLEVKNLTDEQGKVITLYAQWQANSYGIKFEANGGAGEMTDQILAIDAEKSLTQNKFDRKGYTFIGWNTEADGKGTSYSDKEKIKNLSNQSGETVMLYAQWTANSYKVQFEANGGTGTMKDQAFTYDASAELSENKYTRKGYIFSGWNTKADGTGQQYENQAAVSNLTEKPDAPISLYAQWKLEEYTVKYDSQGGSSIPQETYTIEKGLAKLPSSSRKGYTFLGWFEGDKPVTKIPDGSTGDRILTAKWELNTYTITFEDGSSKPISYTVESETFALPEKTKKGYQFQGWVAVAKNGEVSDKPLREITKGTSENYTLRASYQANRYQIQFDANQGTGKMTALEMLYDTPAKLNKNSFTREGYSFAGWNTQKDGKGTEFKDQMEVKNLLSDPDGSITLYAQWTKQTSVLEDLVNQEKEKNRDKNDYTPDSWKDYEEALKQAQEALNDPAASAELLEERFAALEKAIANLKVNTASVILPGTYWTPGSTYKSYPTAVATTERKSLPQTGSIMEPSFLFTGLLAVGASLAGWKRKQKK